jgi:hypothetical protein
MAPNVKPHELALQTIAGMIQANPTTDSSRQLRQMLWSLSSNVPLVNLWCLCSRTSPAERQLVRKVLGAALSRSLSRQDIGRALLISGERERSQREGASLEWLEQLREVEHRISVLARVAPPGPCACQAARLLQIIGEARASLLNKPGASDLLF